MKQLNLKTCCKSKTNTVVILLFVVRHTSNKNYNFDSIWLIALKNSFSKIVSGVIPYQQNSYHNLNNYGQEDSKSDYINKERVHYENVELLKCVRPPKKEELSESKRSPNNYDNLDRIYGEFNNLYTFFNF